MASDAAEGDIVRIDLDEAYCCFAKLLVSPLVCFYDNRSAKQDATPALDPKTILFKVWVSKEGWKNKRWKVVGHEELTADEKQSPEFFKIDKIDKRYYKYNNGKFTPTSREACVGLERAAVWDPVHIEKRLEAYFAGEVSDFEKSMRA